MAELFVGTSGWSYPHWAGSFYPEGWPKRRWLEYYATQFRTVEVNATFYRTFQDNTYHNWRDRAPEGFRYVLKAPRYITHRLHLVDAEEPIRRFCGQAALLKERLGLILLQLAPSTPYELERLRKALVAFTDPSRVAVEFRHSRWLTEETRELLRDVGAAFCTADSPRSRLCDWVTSPVAYIRLHGRKRWYAYDYTAAELEEIAALARGMAEQGAKEVYVFFNNDFEGYAPRNALVLQAMLGRE
ncbi:MAG: DUF72 domain-containing protein, partial [Anaerolineae bacterium]|nr:DUF72 domain-containing protein [Anaerolineae bacterium]